jgi:hypothetical protein
MHNLSYRPAKIRPGVNAVKNKYTEWTQSQNQRTSRNITVFTDYYDNTYLRTNKIHIYGAHNKIRRIYCGFLLRNLENCLLFKTLMISENITVFTSCFVSALNVVVYFDGGT